MVTHGYATNISSIAIYDYMTNVGNATTNGYVMNYNGYMMSISNDSTT
jgi:hypothetical protein